MTVLATWAAISVAVTGLIQRDQLRLAIADQILAPHGFQRRTQHWPVGRIVVTQKRLVQAPLLLAFCSIDTFVVAASQPAAGLAAQMLGGTSADNLPQQVMVVLRIAQVPSPVDDL